MWMAAELWGERYGKCEQGVHFDIVITLAGIQVLVFLVTLV